MKDKPEALANLLENAPQCEHPHTKEKLIWVMEVSASEDNLWSLPPQENCWGWLATPCIHLVIAAFLFLFALILPSQILFRLYLLIYNGRGWLAPPPFTKKKNEICFHLYYIEDYSHERQDRGTRSVEQSDRIKAAKKAKKEAKQEPDGQNAPEDHGGGVVSPRFGQAITSRGI